MEKKPRWNMGEIKSMATGGWMSIARKNRDPIFQRWQACLLMSSNYKVPEWGSASNDVYALIRRFAPFPFKNSVLRPNTDMPGGLVAEGAAIFVACLRSYHWVRTYVGKSAFNKIGPAECLANLDEMLVELHPFVNFLETSGKVEFAPEGCTEAQRRSYYCPLTRLHEVYVEWLKESDMKNLQPWRDELYGLPLTNRYCTISSTRESLVYPRNEDGAHETPRQKFVYGCDISTNY